MSDTIFSYYNNVKNYNTIHPILMSNGEYSKNSLDYIIQNLENVIRDYKNIKGESKMINSQITDSVTQIIKYKEGMGKGSISKIIIQYHEDSKYDDVINKYNNPNDLHIPSVEEFKVLHNYLSGTIIHKNYITTESLDSDHVTLCVFERMIYIQANRSDTHSVLLAQIEYNT